jgi:hypothetical protein
MSAQKHTPGPWIATNCGSHIQVHRQGWPRDAWSVCSFGFQANDKANAQLIASAPDLLQVARDFLLLAALHDWEGAAIDFAKATLAKAEGVK